MDKIIIKNLKIYAYHGVNEEEKQNGQIFLIDVKLKFASLSKPGFSDNLNDTVSYSKVIKTISKVVTEKSYDLLETVAEKVATTIFNEYPLVEKICVCMKKPMAPIKASFDYVGVKINRCREDVEKY